MKHIRRKTEERFNNIQGLIMKNIKLLNRLIYYIFLSIFIIFIISGFIFSKVDRITPADNKTKTVIKPDEVDYIDDNTIEYHLSINTASKDSMAISFVSRHQEIEVYADEELIYCLRAHKSIYGITPGTNYVTVNIPAYTTDIVIRMTNVYDNIGLKETTFEYGDETKIVKEMISGSFVSAVLSSFIILVGITMIMLWIFCRKRINQTQALLYFGIFAIIIGGWALNETSIATLFIDDRKIASLIGYIMLMMIPIPFVQAERNFFYEKKATISNIFSALFAVTDIILLVLHMTGLVEFKKSVIFIHLMLVMSFMYFCGVVIKRIRDKGFDRKVRTNIIAVAALGLSMVVDMVAYYKGMQQTDVIGKLGILVFILLLGYESISEAFEKIKEGQKAAFYKEMAEKDSMTGLYNRSAFEEWEKNTEDYTGYAIVTFDLNNLKYCNDNLGHAVGDAYIETSAKLIRNVFGRQGKCYRIGGDEFCTLVKVHNNRFDIDKYRKRLRWHEKNMANDTVVSKLRSEGLDIQIACGYAEYDNSIDKDFEDTRSRADKKMYESKKILKSV